MSKTRKEQQKELFQLLERDEEQLVNTLREMPTIEVADFLSQLNADQRLGLFKKFTAREQGYIISDLPDSYQLDVVKKLSVHDIVRFLTPMRSDERVDLFQLLPVRQQQRLLPYLSKSIRDDIIHLQSYPAETAGSIMSSDFATITDNMQVKEAMAKIRKDAPSKDTIYYVYVVNAQRELIGFVSLKNLILTDPDQYINDIYHKEFIAAQANDDQERVIKKIEKYDLIAIPIVNQRKQLVGIVTYDDAMDILRQEHTEDMEKFMGISGSHENYTYLRLSAWQHYTNRIFWLLGLAILGICSAFVIRQFEETLSTFIILTLYMPLLIDSGGNSGGQAATVVVRALALGELTARKWWRVLWKELRVSLMLSLSLGALTFGIVYLLTTQSIIPAGFTLPYVSSVIAIALGLQVLTATLMGSLVPLIATTVKIDPAVISSPAITTLVDITGLLIYFGVAQLMLIG